MRPPAAEVEIRARRAGDEPAIRALLEGLSRRPRSRRWTTTAPSASAGADDEAPEVVERLVVAGEQPVGHGVVVAAADGRGGELAFEVAAPWHHHAVAEELLEALVGAASNLGLIELRAGVALESTGILAVLREHGREEPGQEEGIVTFVLPVPPPLAGGLRDLAWPMG